MDAYFEAKKKAGLFFTKSNMNPAAANESMISYHQPVTSKDGISFWDRGTCRYRTYEEQRSAARRFDTSKSMPPLSPKMLKELIENRKQPGKAPRDGKKAA